MKTKLLIVILFILIMLSSCKKVTLDPPKGFIYDETKNILSWEKVNDVNCYKLSINSDVFVVYDNFLDLSNYDNGTYEAKVKSVFPKGESIYTSIYTFTISAKIKNIIYMKENTIYFNELKGDTYKISYKDNLNNNTLTLKKNYFVIPDALKDKKTTIRIESIINDEVAETSNLTLNLNITKVYKNETFIINCINPKMIYLNDLKVKEGFTLYEDKVVFNDTFVNKMDDESLLSIIGEDNQIIKLQIISNKLILLSEAKQVFANNDVFFEYLLNGYELTSITSLSNPKLTSNDYSFANGKLIIFKDYINRFINENKGKELIFSLSFKIDNHNEIVYLTITFN